MENQENENGSDAQVINVLNVVELISNIEMAIVTTEHLIGKDEIYPTEEIYSKVESAFTQLIEAHSLLNALLIDMEDSDIDEFYQRNA
jgi:hypothetical protein